MLVLKGIKCCPPTDHTLLNTNSIANIYKGSSTGVIVVQCAQWVRDIIIELTIVKFEVSSIEP